MLSRLNCLLLGFANLFIQYKNLKFLAASYAGGYEKASTIITLNKAFSDWIELCHDPIIVTAILDRLLYHSFVINIKGNSYRLKDKVKEKELKDCIKGFEYLVMNT